MDPYAAIVPYVADSAILRRDRADSAKASFKDGVLEVTLQAPSKEVSRGRRVNIE